MVEEEAERFSASETVMSLLLPLFLIVAPLNSKLAGLATPTEASAQSRIAF